MKVESRVIVMPDAAVSGRTAARSRIAAPAFNVWRRRVSLSLALIAFFVDIG
jgi:hypothetical protein